MAKRSPTPILRFFYTSGIKHPHTPGEYFNINYHWITVAPGVRVMKHRLDPRPVWNPVTKQLELPEETAR